MGRAVERLAVEPWPRHLLHARDAPPGRRWCGSGLAGRPRPGGAGAAMTRLAPRPQPDRLAPPPPPAPPLPAEPPPLPSDDPITRLPLLVLFPHSRCNCRCLMCDIWRDRGRRELAAADVARWLPEWRRLGVERVVLSGGEALLHT